MKAYFIIRDFMLESLASSSAGIALRSYKIDGEETLTTDFFVDNQVVSANPALDYNFCRVQPEGGFLFATIDPTLVNAYNPFSKHFGLEYGSVSGTMRGGLPIGTLNGNDYGAGVLNIGQDVEKIKTGSGTYVDGSFYLEVDFTKDLAVQFDIITNIIGDKVYEDPQVLRKYKIIWNVEKCYREFSYYSFQTQQVYQDSGYGFLNGLYYPSDADPFINFREIECGTTTPRCPDKERTRSFAMFVDIPLVEEEKETITECCYQAEVLAQVEGNDYEKNDFTGVYHKKQIASETAEFVLIKLSDNSEIDLDNDDLGTFKDFGTITDNPNLKTFVLDWQKVLNEYGEGAYTILKRVDIAGMIFEESNINYNLKKYSTARADKSVRIDVTTNGLMERLGIDFANSNFKTSLRFGGFFGRREPKYEEDTIVYSNFVSEQISMSQTNEYLLQTNLLPSCITQQIIDFLLFANDIYLNDYNLNNHLRNFVKFPVKFADNKGTNYFTTTTKAVLNLSFSDKIVNNIKRNY